MNFVFLSPHFPHTYWQFCQWLYQNGVKVLGIAVAYFAFRYGRIDYWGYDSAHDWAWWRKQIVYFMDHLLTEETVEYVI